MSQHALPNISAVKPRNQADMPVIEEIIEVLRRHGALNRFGLTLLHQHFPVGKDEILVETTDVSARMQTIAPRPLRQLKVDYIETSWRLDSGKPVMVCVCIVQSGEHTGTHQNVPGRAA